MSSRNAFFLVLCAALTVACTVEPERESAIGEAYAGPAKLLLRKDIDTKSPAVATAHFGDKLDIIARKRRWYKVRTASGAIGWTDDRALLDPAQMSRLRELARETGNLPSQGAAKSFDVLNMHTEPNRQAPSFAQLKEGEAFDVIAHRVMPRSAPPRRELIPPRPRTQDVARKNKLAAKLPPPPAPPAVPADWIKLSEEREPPPDPDAAPVQHDDWTLIRTHNGQSGWVLTSAIYMLIPDEVAQYAEGHRITSYFSLGKIADGDLKKDIWLWTTSEKLGEDHDFDSYRVFVWSLRHHRYETAYIQRREMGFFPVLANTGEFSVCLEDDNGTRIRKRYVMQGNLVRPSGAAACEKLAEVQAEPEEIAVTSNSQAPAQQAAKAGVMQRIETKVKTLFGK